MCTVTTVEPLECRRLLSATALVEVKLPGPGLDEAPGMVQVPLEAVLAQVEESSRVPDQLRHRSRAVTALDFASLVLETPGVTVARVVVEPQDDGQDDNGKD